MVATTASNHSHPQTEFGDMSSIESGCVENVFFTVKNLYTGKRTIRQVKHEELTKVSFVLGQLATQNVVVKELMFLICAIIGDLPLSESIFSHDLPFPASQPFSPQETSTQLPSTLNQEPISEQNASETNATSESLRKENLRPRPSSQKSTPRSKSKSRKRNVFTEDEADDEDEKERSVRTTRSKVSRLSHESGKEPIPTNDTSFNSDISSLPQTSVNESKPMAIEEKQSFTNNASEEKSIITNDLNNLDAMMSTQPVYEPIVITSCMIEATDDDYDEDDPGPPDQFSDDTEYQQNLSQTHVPVEISSNVTENDPPIEMKNKKNKELQESESCNLLDSSSITQKQQKENYDPVVSLESINVSKSRKSTKSNPSPSQSGKRESRRISDIKREADKESPEEGCETKEPIQVKTPKNKEKTSSVVSPANSTPGNYDNLRPGAPHYCEICGKHFDGKNRTTSRVAHMAHAHFKDKLMKDLEDKSPPFRCPAPDCSYQTRERDKWSRHYGSVHGLIKKYLKQYFDEHPEEKRSVSSNNIDQTSQLPNTLTSPLSSDTSINKMSNSTKESNNAQDSPHLKIVKEKFILKKNAGQNERRKKLRKNNGRSIFKRRKGKLRKNLNKVDDNKIKDSEPEEKKTEEEKKELTPGDGRCKYSSGKVNGLEKCIGCGVGYSSNSALKRHYESVHLRIKKAQCPYCPVRMSQRHNLRNHINAIHLNNKRHQCKICQFSCWKKPDFERHMQKHEEGEEMPEESTDKDIGEVKEIDTSTENDPIDKPEAPHETQISNPKSKKVLPSKIRKRNQRKKNATNDENENESCFESDTSPNQNIDLSKKLPTSQLYPTYVIKKRIGCSRSGPHRMKKPQPKTQPKLTVVISKVGGQIIAKKKEDNPVKQENIVPINPTSLGRKSLEAQLAESITKQNLTSASELSSSFTKSSEQS